MTIAPTSDDQWPPSLEDMTIAPTSDDMWPPSLEGVFTKWVS